ncbi:hypothetical protein DCBHLPFO_00639 [Mycoplasmopsis arginini]|uniref:Uncharacterized protein n=1 Tax=Mycoplasmopsis arginini TaxID=2094 RepID=A0AA43QXG2_MYCAR|nr:hypothetical protein [Mycoplasmopsis arginini]
MYSILITNTNTMKNVHLIPTDKPSKLYYWEGKLRLGNLTTAPKNLGISNQHIYITSDEEIKEGDWYLNIEEKNGIKNPFYGKLYKANESIYKVSLDYLVDNLKKIILTTDQDLIDDGVQAIDDEFLEWFVKNPSCEEFEVKKEYITPLGDIVETCYDNERLNYKIIIPKEIGFKVENGKRTETFYQEPKQETLEEAAEKFAKKFGSEIDSTRYYAFINGAKWQQERMYSVEEVENILIEYVKTNPTKPYRVVSWFQQIKKK